MKFKLNLFNCLMIGLSAVCVTIAMVYVIVPFWMEQVPQCHNTSILLWYDGVFAGFMQMTLLSLVLLACCLFPLAFINFFKDEK